ncbi:MAG: endonuclease/exonuclease/phosphatase family protein [Bacteroidales bacterium]|nr:endonuclease/exonuclease/phosphatase family protein [Lentimicrobiaceae bacterium]MDD5695483.1 endonuclease/exonuclease/phosphatase family protein [Bacteroidales bacterium]
MKKFTALMLLCWIPFLLLAQSDPGKGAIVTVMTYNIRLNTPDDGTHAWKFRKPAVVALINRHQPDIYGVQEALHDQMKDMAKSLPGYGWFGVARDDGKTSGEYAAVFYAKKRFKRMDGSTFWLSETPDKRGSKGWDAACVRIVTWVKLKDRLTGETLFFFNTHFDHMGTIARTESAKLLLLRIQEIAGDFPVVVTGDFNLRESEEPYLILTAGKQDFHLTDTRHHAQKSSDPDYTYMGFDFVGEPGEIIDYIFIHHVKEVLSHQIITDNTSGIYPSDHLPVMAKLIPTFVPAPDNPDRDSPR